MIIINIEDQDHHHCICLLDSSMKSNLLHDKISDIPHRLKLEIHQFISINPQENFKVIFPYYSIISNNNTSSNSITINSTINHHTIDYNQSPPPFLLDKKRDFQFLKSLALIFPEIVQCIPELLFDKQVALERIRNPLNWNEWFKNCTLLIQNNSKHDLFSDKKWVIELFETCKLGYSISSFASCLSDTLKKDKQVAKIVCKLDNSLGCFHQSIKDDRELVLEIAKENGMVILSMNSKFKDDFEILSTAIKNRPDMLEQIENLPFLKYWLEENPQDFQYLSLNVINNPELILIGIKKKFFKDLESDQEFYSDYFTSEMIIEALKEGHEFIPEKYCKEKSVFRQAVKMKPSLFELADKSLKCDKDFVMELIEIDPLVMIYINEPLSNDLDIAKCAVKKNGLVLQYFTDRIRENEEIVTISVNQNPKSIEFSLIQNMEIVIQVLESDGMCLQFINSHFKELKQVILTAVKSNGHSYKFIDNSLKVDRDIVIESLCNGCPYFQIDSKLRIDKEIAIIALKNDSRAFKYIEQSIRNDLQIIKACESSKSNWWIN